jgi:hypothetical protein
MDDKTTQSVFDSVFGEKANHAQRSTSFLLASLAIAMTAAILILQPSWPAVAGVVSMNGMVAVVGMALSKQSRE